MRMCGGLGLVLTVSLAGVLPLGCATATEEPVAKPGSEGPPGWALGLQRQLTEASGSLGGEVVERVVTRELVVVDSENRPVAVLRESPDRSGGWLRIKGTGGYNLIDLSASEESVTILVKGNRDDTGSWSQITVSAVNGRTFVSVGSMVGKGPLGPIDAGASLSLGIGQDGRPVVIVTRETGEVVELDLLMNAR